MIFIVFAVRIGSRENEREKRNQTSRSPAWRNFPPDSG